MTNSEMIGELLKFFISSTAITLTLIFVAIYTAIKLVNKSTKLTDERKLAITERINNSFFVIVPFAVVIICAILKSKAAAMGILNF